jgi:UDP-4-amino-4,6-dideoxy-N-acetyl-beta-L-altrosamine transaminase
MSAHGHGLRRNPDHLRQLPYARQVIERDDIEAVARVLDSDWLTTGPAVGRFEAALAERVGARYAVSVSSGTAALHLAALALGMGPGMRAVVPSVTFLATANAIAYTGAEVAFADVDPETGRMRASDLETALDRIGGADAVLPVDLAGHADEAAGVGAVAKDQGLKVIDDASHALGASYEDREGHVHFVGSCGHADCTAFSFHPTKIAAMGEGGVITTNSEELARTLEGLRSHGVTRDPSRFKDKGNAFDREGNANPWYYEMHALGFNYRASDMQCALGLSQLAKLGRFLGTRRRLARHYHDRLKEAAPLVRPVRTASVDRSSWHLFTVLIDFERAQISRASTMRALTAAGIGTQVHYIPVHKQPHYRAMADQPALPGAERYYARCLSLPMWAGMDTDDVDRVVDTLLDILDPRY